MSFIFVENLNLICPVLTEIWAHLYMHTYVLLSVHVMKNIYTDWKDTHIKVRMLSNKRDEVFCDLPKKCTRENSNAFRHTCCIFCDLPKWSTCEKLDAFRHTRLTILWPTEKNADVK